MRTNLFNIITGCSRPPAFNHIEIASTGLRPKLETFETALTEPTTEPDFEPEPFASENETSDARLTAPVSSIGGLPVTLEGALHVIELSERWDCELIDAIDEMLGHWQKGGIPVEAENPERP